MAEIRLLIEINSVIYNLDLSKDEAIKINYSIAATSNPTKRSGSFSRDIKLPATKHNIKTLGFLHELNDFDTKDVTNRKTAWIEVDGNIFIKGYMRADAIYRNFKIKHFRVRVFGDNIDIKDLLSAQTLNTLDFGQITLNVAAIEATWAHTDSDDGDFVFPLINYGKWNGTTNGYDYVAVDDLAPAIFFKAFNC